MCVVVAFCVPHFCILRTDHIRQVLKLHYLKLIKEQLVLFPTRVLNEATYLKIYFDPLLAGAAFNLFV